MTIRNAQSFAVTLTIRNCLIGFSVFLLQGPAFSQIYSPEVERFAIESGLSQSTVTDIVQDDNGFLWMGTQDGLNKFDGYSFKIFRGQANDGYSLPNDYITRLVKDTNGDLWIGSKSGLVRMDMRSGEFVRYDSAILGRKINDLVFDAECLWIATDDGLYKAQTSPFSVQRIELMSGPRPGDLRVYMMVRDSAGHLWLATSDGVQCVDTRSYHVRLLQPGEGRRWQNEVRAIAYFSNRIWLGAHDGLWSVEVLESSLQKDSVIRTSAIEHFGLGTSRFQSLSGVLSIFQDTYGQVWIGTESDGLFRMGVDGSALIAYKHSYMQGNEWLNSTSVNRIFQDQFENIWIGTLEQGLFKIAYSGKKFGMIRSMGDDGRGLSSNRVRGLLEDGKYLWIGTARGLNRLNRESMMYDLYIHDPSDPTTLSSNDIKTMTKDQLGNMWIATNNGLNKLNTKSYTVDRFVYKEYNDDNVIFNNKVRNVAVVDDSLLWVSTLGGGISVLNPLTNQLVGRFHTTVKEGQGLTDNNVMQVYQRDSGEVWVVTYGGGLFRRDGAGKGFVKIPLHHADREALLLSSVNEDDDGYLWVGSYGDGFFQVDPAEGMVGHFNIGNGPTSNVIYAVVSHKDQLWLSSNNGLIKYQRSDSTFHIFSRSDGLQSNEFNTASYLKTESGDLFFGGVNGLTFFHPDSIVEDSKPPIIAFTDLKIFNQSIQPGQIVGDSEYPPLRSSLADSAQVVLSPQHSVFSVEFAALDFRSAHDTKYAYRLDGFDTRWRETDSENRVATYTRLAPGDYKFLVKATNSDGYWSDQPIMLYIEVLPAYWQTIWFKLMVVSGTLLAIMGFVYYRNRQERRVKKFLKEEVKRNTVEVSRQKDLVEQKNLRLVESRRKLKRMSQRKDQLFFLLAHNLRSPLTSLSGFLGLLSGREKVISQEDFNRHAGQMKYQVDDSLLLLDNVFYWSLIHFEEVKPKVSRTPILKSVQSILERYEPKAKSKKVEISVISKVNCEVLGDTKMLDVILENLISNAVKYAFAESCITAEIAMDEDQLHVVVENRGPVMSPSMIRSLFDPDNHHVMLGTAKERGAGIGLIVSLELAALMGFELFHVNATELTRFVLTIPATKVLTASQA